MKIFLLICFFILGLILAVFVYQITNAFSTVVPSGLIGHWKFDEGSASTTMDSSGNGHSGTLTNISGPGGWVTSRVGLNNAIRFDGVNDYVSITNAGDLSKGLSIAGWVYLTSASASGVEYLFADQNAAEACCGPIVFFSLAPNSVPDRSVKFNFVSCTPSGVFRHSAANAVSYNTWQFITITWNGGKAYTGIHIYVNGVEVTYDDTDAATCTGTLANGTGSWIIGGRTSDNLRNLLGNIDDVRVYSRVLTQAEISRIYSLRQIKGQGVSR